MTLSAAFCTISTHSPTWGRPLVRRMHQLPAVFLLTSPCGGRLGDAKKLIHGNPQISTHAPAWGATQDLPHEGEADADFYSRPPRGGRRAPGSCPCRSGSDFYSRPAWGATIPAEDGENHDDISTHAPAWGATRILLKPTEYLRFLLTPPYGGRQQLEAVLGGLIVISTHAPEWGAHTPARHAAGRNRRVTAVKGGSAPSHPRQNQSSPSGSASQTIGEKGSGLKPIRTPLGTLSSFTTAS